MKKTKTQAVKKGLLREVLANKEEKKAASAAAALVVPDEVKSLDNADDSGDDLESLDSDEELQLAFARRQLTPGLNVILDKPKRFVNDEAGLKRKLKELYLDMEWIERLDVTVATSSLGTAVAGETPSLTDDDFKRESLFLRQAEAAVRSVLPKLNEMRVATQRAENYFAEMAKSDEHMKKVRESLLSKHAEMEKRDKVRKLREMKKMGKQIQQEVEKRKQESKKNFKESLKKFKKGDKESLQIELEHTDPKKAYKNNNNNNKNARSSSSSGRKMTGRDEAPPREDAGDMAHANGGGKRRQGGADAGKPNGKDKMKPTSKRANFKDKKYGFGGRKKRSKYNTAESYAEAFSGNDKTNGKFGAKKGGVGGASGGGGKRAPRGGVTAHRKPDKKFMNKNKPKQR